MIARRRQVDFAIFVARLVLGGVFLYTGVAKLLGFNAFQSALALLELVPLRVLTVTAVAIPLIEAVCGVFVLSGLLIRTGSAILAFLLLLFLILLAPKLGTGAECGCFGGGAADPIDGWFILRDSILLMMAGFIAACDPGSQIFVIKRIPFSTRGAL